MSGIAPMTAEMKKLHRKLIPANIIICLIALIAGISMLIMPFLDIRVHISGAKVATLLQGDTSTEQAGETDAFSTVLTDALSGVELDIPVNLYPLKMLKAATGTGADVTEFFASVIGKNGASEFVNEFVSKLAPAVTKAALKSSIALDDKYDQDLDNIINHLSGSAPNKDLARQEFNALVTKMAADKGEEAPDTAEMEEMFDMILEKGSKEDGTFDFTYLMQNIDMNDINSSGDSSTDTETPATPETPSTPETPPATGEGGTEDTGTGDQTTDTTTPPATDDSATTGDNPMNEIISILENPASLISDELDSNPELLSTIQLVLLIIFVLFVGIPAFFWLLLALCAFLRIFMEKKRVRTWYVKLFCLWAGLIVLAGNLAAPTLLGLLGEGFAEALAITFMGSGVITGVCWVLLVLISWFYYNRIKRRIKRLQRQNDEELFSTGEKVKKEESEFDRFKDDVI